MLLFKQEGKKSFLHLVKLTLKSGGFIVETYDGESMSASDAMKKMRVSLSGYKSYKYSGVSSESEKYKKWYHKKDAGYSNTEAWEEIFGSKS